MTTALDELVAALDAYQPEVVGGRRALDAALARAGASVPVDVAIVPAIEREPGHAAQVKLVVSEVPPPA